MVLNVLNNYCLLLNKLVKYLRFFDDIHPEVHTLHGAKYFDEDIPENSLLVVSGYTFFPVY